MVVCEPLVDGWPVDARVAFRRAVFSDISAFAPDSWSDVEVLVAARIFYEYWKLGRSWPPIAAPAPDLRGADTYTQLADLAEAVGIDLATVWLAARPLEEQ